ncbi:MAG: FAD-binding oxidoreductase [Rhodobacteraceae bacterium]|uniref:FAD-binding oxidoreductase n=1 Tax=Cypionkella sp. TaxID=2811411 RepID=UPI00132A4FD2|nr:FAD-binding oxidoreductase [Cypionkella sp.]KAF0172365.1 MAG: FAD-binding oxidoreductase [Paracoccaceae bacterium]MDO8327527.1 FAD-binding oxidoreductase [Cypionkella sp.]
MTLLVDLTAALGPAHVITGPDLDRYRSDWTTHFTANPIAAVRPGSTAEVSEVMRIAARHGVAVVPVSGRTGLVGGAMTEGGLMLSVERLNRIRDIRRDARIAIVEAGVVLDRLHEAAEAENLYFPLWFGARGSAMIGGVLSTNAGGSNVLRYGSTRALCLGLEVVLSDGRVLNLMSQLHKDNSGYDLKQLFIGAEGTLGVITAAVMKLVPRPRAYATATLAVRSVPDALALLNRLQLASGGLVEAFEYMPETYMHRLAEARPDIRQPFTPRQAVNILVELGSTRPSDAVASEDGTLPLTAMLQDALEAMLGEGMVLDAEIAQTEAQRRAMWQRRELAAEITVARQPAIDTDICLPLDGVALFLDRIHARLPSLDAEAETLAVAHLGDGNIHFTVFPTSESPALYDRVVEAVEDEVQALAGSFSAEHGVGLSKLASMQRRKDPVALEVMRAVKAALDPANRMNPGKVIPPKA